MAKKKYIMLEGVFDSEEEMVQKANQLNTDSFSAGSAIRAQRMRDAIDAARKDGTMRTNKRYANIFSTIEDIFEHIKFVTTIKELDNDNTYYVNDDGSVILSFDKYCFYEDVLEKMLEYEKQGSRVFISEIRGEITVPYLTEKIDHMPSMFPRKVTGSFYFSFFDPVIMLRTRIPALKITGRRLEEKLCTHLKSCVNMPVDFDLCDTVKIGRNMPEFDSPEMIAWAKDICVRYKDTAEFVSTGNFDLQKTIMNSMKNESFTPGGFWRVKINEEFESSALNTLLQKPENKTIFRTYARHCGILWSEISDYQVKKLTTEYDYGEVKSALVHNKTTDGTAKSKKYKAMICTDSNDKITAIISGGNIQDSIKYIDPKITALIDFRMERLFKYRDVITDEYGIPSSSFPRGSMTQGDRVSLHMFLCKIVYLVLCACCNDDSGVSPDFMKAVNISGTPKSVFDNICKKLKIFRVQEERQNVGVRYMYYDADATTGRFAYGPVTRSIYKGDGFIGAFKFNNTTNDSVAFLRTAEVFNFPVQELIAEDLLRAVMALASVNTTPEPDDSREETVKDIGDLSGNYHRLGWINRLNDEQRNALFQDQLSLKHILADDPMQVYNTMATKEVRNSLLYSLNPGSDIKLKDFEGSEYGIDTFGKMGQFGYLWMLPDFISRLYIISSAGFNRSNNDEFFDTDTKTGEQFLNMTPDEQLTLLANRKEERRADWHQGQDDRKRMQIARANRRSGMTVTSKEANMMYKPDFAQHKGFSLHDVETEKFDLFGSEVDRIDPKDPMRRRKFVGGAFAKDKYMKKFEQMPVLDQITSLFVDFKFMREPLERLVSSQAIDDDTASMIIGMMCNFRKILYIYAYLADGMLETNPNSRSLYGFGTIFNVATKSLSKMRVGLTKGDMNVINDMRSSQPLSRFSYYRGVNLITSYSDANVVMPIPVLTNAVQEVVNKFNSPHTVAMARKSYNAEIRERGFEI